MDARNGASAGPMRLLTQAAQLVGAAGIVLMLVVSAFAAIERYVFHTSGAWIEEIEQYLMLMTVFVVSGSAYTDGEHVNAGMLVRLLPLRGRRIAALATDVIGLAFCGFMFWESLLKALQLHAARIHSGTSLQTPLYLVALLLPISMVLLGVAFASRMTRTSRDGEGSA
ncbi:TRAP transporter small permease [bacterium]|nr:MAG: TRAP transporter small permease [bacterium]